MKNRIPVILCIGSEKICGDSLGPAVGDLLTEKYNIKCFVYGISERSVNGETLNAYLDFIRFVHKDAPLLAVDACLGKNTSVGKIKASVNGVCPKKAVTGSGERVGDVGILGVVGQTGGGALAELMSVPAERVEFMSAQIAFMLNAAFAGNTASGYFDCNNK